VGLAAGRGATPRRVRRLMSKHAMSKHAKPKQGAENKSKAW
jgi:hypothetical protein